MEARRPVVAGKWCSHGPDILIRTLRPRAYCIAGVTVGSREALIKSKSGGIELSKIRSRVAEENDSDEGAGCPDRAGYERPCVGSRKFKHNE